MKQTTQQHLINAFGGESMAHIRYLHFADIAIHERFPNVARLFKAINSAEFVHAGDNYKEIRPLDGGFVANSAGSWSLLRSFFNHYLRIISKKKFIE